MRLLVVEDDPRTAAYLCKGFAESGYVVDAAADGAEALHLALDGSYDAIILDVMLPEIDGWQVLREFRATGRTTPVLCLTARDSVTDRVRGLDLGADDYLVKPFAFSELLARVRTVLRRGPAREAETLRVGDLELDLVRRRATRAGVRLDLTPKEFALLALLVRHEGEPLSRTVIAEQVWDINFDCDSNVVDVHVRRLRAKVDEPFAAPLVHTLRGVGYVLEHRP